MLVDLSATKKNPVAPAALIDAMGFCPVSQIFLCIKSIKDINCFSEGETLKSSDLSRSFLMSELLCSILMGEIQIKP